MIRKYYTDDELISELHRFKRENGRNPVQKDMQIKFGYPSYGAYVNRFGSWNNTLTIAGFEISNKHRVGTLDGTETCSYCGRYSFEIPGFTGWRYIDNKRYCNKHGRSGRGGKPDYTTGNLDINSNVGIGRAGEILVAKTLKIANEFDCNRISCGYKFDLYHNEYKKINVKTCKLFNKYRWIFNFNKKQDADTYICIGLSSDRKIVEHIWIVPNKGNIRNTSGITIHDTYRSLSNRRHWEVDCKLYDDMWQTMKLKTCKIMVNKKKEETEEEKQKHEEFKKAYFKKLGIEE